VNYGKHCLFNKYFKVWPKTSYPQLGFRFEKYEIYGLWCCECTEKSISTEPIGPVKVKKKKKRKGQRKTKSMAMDYDKRVASDGNRSIQDAQRYKRPINV
jgi:hypothetical protein